MYTEAELKKQTNASLNRKIDEINTEIKRRRSKRPRLKKSGNKQTRIDRILAYYAPKPIEPEPEPELEPEPEPEPVQGVQEVERLEIGDKMKATLRGPDGEVKGTTIVTDEAERFYNETFSLPTGCPDMRTVQSQMREGFLNDEDFVRWAYLKVLGREPDPNGKTVYVAHLNRGTLNRQGLITALFGSDEYRGKRIEGFFDNPSQE